MLKKLLSMGLTLSLLLALQAMSYAGVTVSISADPASYTGKCPASITFTAKIASTERGNVQYRFTRSDGALSMVETLKFDAPGTKTVRTTWTLGGERLPSFSGWQAMESLYPETVSSDRANFSIRCQSETAEAKEDCVRFDPGAAEVKNVGGRWKIVEGNHLLFDFDNQAEAAQALKTMKFYGLNQSCFVGRPDPSFKYLLINGAAPPAVAMEGEDCIGFNPATAEVKKMGGIWKIVDGSHAMFDFGNKEAEARNALGIIKKYGFSNSCFVGRPGPSFTYLRK